MSALSNVLQSYYSSGKIYESVYCVLLTRRKQLWFLNHSTEVYFHKRNQLHIDTTAHRLYFVMKCCSDSNEIWCWVDWWTFSICMWRTLGIFGSQWSLMFLLKFWYQLQDFERERKWKLGQAKKVALRVSRSKLDFEAREIRHQKVRCMKLWIVQLWRTFK
jgi:hypothetical protein